MKLEERNGFTFVDGQRVFSVDPDDIIWRLRDDWLGLIREGHDVFAHPIFPYFEMEAVSRLEKEWSTYKSNKPDICDGYEDWRLWWMNEASHNCVEHSPVGRAGNHLSPVGQVAVNILMTCSALRDAIEAGKAQEAAALGMLLICEALSGGYSLKSEAAIATVEATKESKKQAYETGAGRSQADLNLARTAAIAYAKKKWASSPETRIGDMAKEIIGKLVANKEKLPTLQAFPKVDTVKAWLRDAGASGSLVIPSAAQKRGRMRQT